MYTRWALILVGLVIQSGVLKALDNADSLAQGKRFWEEGQAAMRQGRPAKAIDLYTKSLTCSPSLSQSHLSLAAAYLEIDHKGLACFHLNEYVRVHGEDVGTRVQLAELLLLLERNEAARRELEICVESAQNLGSSATELLIHCHSRLMEIAVQQGDAYGEHLHRGIGLLLLGGESAASAETEKELPSEGLYCKAAGELTLALDERPDEARPSWYLHCLWSRLGQRLPARRCLSEAEAAAPFSYLTPVEQRGLQMACSSLSSPPSSKR